MNIRKSSAVLVLCLVVCLSVILTASPAGYSHEKNSQLMKITTFEGGTAYKTSDNIYWVLSLNGTWRQMGRQYGGLVREDLRRFFVEITEDVAARGMDKNEQLKDAKAFAGSFNENLRDLLQGISETSGLSEDEVLLLNAGMLNLADAVLGPVAPSACSGLAAWGNYTPDGGMVFGRNWDIDRESMKKYMKYLSVVVFNPDSGNGFANVHPLGNVYLETGMNSKGLFVELNNGVYSDTNIYSNRLSKTAI